MNTPKRYSTILKFSLAAYIIVAVISYYFSFGFRQFFTGTWFIKTPVIIQDYGIYVKAINGQALNPGAYLEWLPEITSKEWYFQIYGQIQLLGRSADNDKTVFVEKNLKVFNNFFKNSKMDFEVHKRTFNTLDYIQNKKIENYVNLPIKK